MTRTTSIHQFPDVLAANNINVNTLGCVMLPVEFSPSLLNDGYKYGQMNEDDLVDLHDPDRFWIAGDVTDKAHITLLYGLLTPAYDQPGNVAAVMDGWKRPVRLPISGFEAFPAPTGETYRVVVARIADDRDGSLADAHARLSYLPHVDTFPEYLPHATIAYVTSDAADRWVNWLTAALRNNSYAHSFVNVPAGSLDLGSKRG